MALTLFDHNFHPPNLRRQMVQAPCQKKRGTDHPNHSLALSYLPSASRRPHTWTIIKLCCGIANFFLFSFSSSSSVWVKFHLQVLFNLNGGSAMRLAEGYPFLSMGFLPFPAPNNNCYHFFLPWTHSSPGRGGGFRHTFRHDRRFARFASGGNGEMGCRLPGSGDCVRCPARPACRRKIIDVLDCLTWHEAEARLDQLSRA